MKITVDGRKYNVKVRGAYAHIKTGKQLARVIRATYVKRYGASACKGKNIFRMDVDLGIISTSRPA